MTTATNVPTLTRDLGIVHEWLTDLVAMAGPIAIPLFGDQDWVDASSEVVRRASLARFVMAQLAELDPGVVAARLAAEIALGRQHHQQTHKQAAQAVSAAHDWSAVAQRRRSGWSR